MSNPIKLKTLALLRDCHMYMKGVPVVTIGAVTEALDQFEDKLTFDNVPRGEQMPQTLENLQAAWTRDQELIFDQKKRISKLEEKLNQKDQKIRQMTIQLKSKTSKPQPKRRNKQ